VNVLITSAGRRATLTKAFRVATHERGGKVVAGDMDGLAPALYLADAAVRLPRVKDAAYVPRLLEVVKEHAVRLVVPTIDTELHVLAESAAAFEAAGAHALVSSPALMGIARDKWQTFTALASEVRLPRSWLPEPALAAKDLPERLFVKPRDGSASLHAYATTKGELAGLLPRVPNAMVQEHVDAPEITIDGLVDLEGEPIHYVPRLRIRTVGGESIQGRTLKDERGLGAWIEKVLRILSARGLRGPVTLQAFLTEGEPTLSEINPRFGGGFPLALAAGADYPRWLLRMLDGERVAPCLGVYKTDLFMTRYYVEEFTETPFWR
jgi:carbamoyl-phosphate synthase large subunit